MRMHAKGCVIVHVQRELLDSFQPQYDQCLTGSFFHPLAMLAGMGLCCYACWCPCLAYKEAAENIGKDDMGIVYCLLPFVELGCCALTLVGDQVAQARGIEHGVPKSAVCACCDCCTCYSCAVLNESRNYKEQQGGAAPSTQVVERK